MTGNSQKINIALVLNTFEFDNRVKKTVESLSKRYGGFLLLCLHKNGLPELESLDYGASVRRIKMEVSRVFPTAIRHAFQYIRLVKGVMKELKNKRVNFIHCNDLNTMFLGYLIKRKHKGASIIYDAHELETERANSGRIKKKLLKRFEKWAISKSSGMITVSPMIAEFYAKDYNITTPTVVMNCPPIKSVEPNGVFRNRFNIPADCKILLYQGLLSPLRGIEPMIEAAPYLEGRWHLVFMGYGILEEKIKEAVKSHENVHFHDAVSGDVLLNYTSNADYGAYMVKGSHLSHVYGVGNKVFEYCMAGVPILSTDLEQPKQILETRGIGVCLPYTEDGRELAEAIKGLPEIDKANLINAREEFNWGNQEKQLFELYDSLADKN